MHMAEGHRSLFASAGIAIVATAAATCLLTFLFAGVPLLLTFRQSVDMQWIGATKLQGDQIIGLLNEYRKKHGRYPAEVTDLVPEYTDSLPQTGPSGKAGASSRWRYECNSDGSRYRLMVTTNHWVSSFDVLVYESDGDYSAWEGVDDRFVAEGWWYCVGGSAVMQ
jgi:hypothetical protein